MYNLNLSNEYFKTIEVISKKVQAIEKTLEEYKNNIPKLEAGDDQKAESYLKKGVIGRFFSRLFNRKITGTVAAVEYLKLKHELAEFNALYTKLNDSKESSC